MDTKIEHILSMDSFVATSEQLQFTDTEVLNETSPDFNEGFSELWQEPSDFVLSGPENYIVAKQDSETCKFEAQKKSSAKLCRLCAFPSDQTIYIFGEEGLKQGLHHKINSSLPITVNVSDPLPKQVCQPCINRLNSIYEFSESCVGIEEKLNFSVKTKIFRSKIILSKSMEVMERTCCNDIEDLKQQKCTKEHVNNVKEGITSDSNMGYSCPFCSHGKMVAYQNNLVANNESVTSDCKTNKDFYFYKDEKEQKWTKNCISLKPDVTDKISITMNSQKPPYASHKKEKIPSRTPSKIFSSNAWNIKNKASLENIKLDGMLLKKSSCQICGEIFHRFSLCQVHSRVHIEKSNYPCILCGRCFHDEVEWLTHFKEHEMNEGKKFLGTLCSFICSDCGAKFNSYAAFDEHTCPKQIAHKCNKCDKYFVSQIKLHLHLNHCCNKINFCDNSFNTYKENLKNPSEYLAELTKLSQYNVSEFSCSQCSQSFETELELTQHLQKVHNSFWACSFRVYKNDPIELQESQPPKLSTRSDSSDVSIGLVLTSPNKHYGYKCNVCSEIFLSPSLANTHVMQHDCDLKNKEIQNIILSLAYECEYCEKLFTNKYSLKKHYESHGKDPLYMCSCCSASFSSYNRAAKHRSTHMKDKTSIPTVFVCFDCDTCFIQWTSLYYHRKTLHEQHSYECYPCTLSFDSLSQFEEHRDSFHYNDLLNVNDVSYTRRRSYCCSVCGETFNLKGAYNKHQKKHGELRPFKCDVCGKSFTQNSGLYTHRRVHTGEKPYPCNFCARTFRLKHDRDNHHRCHTGERPFKCNYCSKAFRTSHDHRQHLLIHTGERPYCCDFCGKGFRRINGLNVHKRIHTGEKPYTCHICERRFTQKGDMLKHSKTQHPQMSDVI